ncbi:MAG: TIGR03960 family B12-binding radical SAM protein [Candidatus Omnitrophota bacterium]
MRIAEEILLKVHKPSQYIGSEWNALKRDFTSSAVRAALGFADLYEVGMSNLGLRIIYGILNNLPGVCCERFFSPEPDMEAILREQKMPLFSLESQRGLGEFDIIGFSLGSELNYTNVLNILDLAGLPLEAANRDSRHPLVVGGGPSVLNPEPLHEFFDLFIIGEAEEVIVEFIDAYRLLKDDFRAGKISKDELLLRFSRIPGIYVPSLYEAIYDNNGDFLKLQARRPEAPERIRKRFIKELSNAYFPIEWLVPYSQTIHDRFTLEIMRGCPNRCRFCQARSQYFPLRFRESSQILELAQRAYQCTGYEEFSLSGLSVSDYPGLGKLVDQLSGVFKSRSVGLSLPSLKAKALLGDVSGVIAKTKKTGLTFAPEAGTERLRLALAKDFSEDDFLLAITEAYQAGYQHLKLYFLIGLPNEKDEDLDGIIEFSRRASELKRKINGSAALINVSVNGLIPKPHTPLQWLPMQSMEALKQKEDYLKSHNRNKRIRFSFHNRQMGYLEGILSRGDRRLSRVIRNAYKNGARFDAWSDHFSLGLWLEAFKQENINPDIYLRGIPVGKPLPWDFLDLGMDKNILIAEFNKSVAI